MRQFHLKLIINKNTRRALEILSTLTNSLHPVTLNTLSEDMGVTTRTLISDMNALKTLLPVNWQLVGEKNKGYTLVYPSEHELATFKQELLIDEILFQLLNGLYNELNYSLRDWSEHLFVSEYTFSRNLAPLKKLLKHYQLELAISPYLKIKGSETNIRLFFFLYFYEAQMTPHVIEPTAEIKEFYHYCLDYVSASSELNPMVQFNKSTYWIMVILQRIKHHHLISLSDSLIAEQQDTRTYSHFKFLASTFSDTFDVTFPESEIAFFSLININNYYFDYDYLLQSASLQIKEAADEELDQLLLKLPQIFMIDHQLVGTINLAIKSYIKNINHLTKLSPLFQLNNHELNTYVQNKLGYLLDKCLTFISENEYFTKHMAIKYPLDVAVNFALITSTFIHQTHYQNKSILFILEGNQNLLLFIRSQTQRFSDQGIQTHFISHMEVTKEVVAELNVNLIVVNYEKFYLTCDVPIIKVPVIPTQNDWNTISSVIFSSPFKQPSTP